MDGMLLEAGARHSIVVLICTVVLSALDGPRLKRRDTRRSCRDSKNLQVKLKTSRLLSQLAATSSVLTCVTFRGKSKEEVCTAVRAGVPLLGKFVTYFLTST